MEISQEEYEKMLQLDRDGRHIEHGLLFGIKKPDVDFLVFKINQFLLSGEMK